MRPGLSRTAQPHLSDERGANLVEYLLLVCAIALTALGASLLGTSVRDEIACYAALVAGSRDACPAAVPQRSDAVYRASSGAAAPPSRDPSLGGVRLKGLWTTHAHFDGPLFAKGNGDRHPIDANDVYQGSLGDCYLMAAISAVAAQNPQLIEDLIRANGDGTYAVSLYDDPWPNRFYIYGDGPVDRRRPALREERVTSAFPVSLPVQAATLGGLIRPTWPLFAQVGDADASGQGELWPMLLEKAYASRSGGYATIEGGLLTPGLKAITGNEAFLLRSFEDLAGAWDQGYAIIGGTIGAEKAKNNPHFGNPYLKDLLHLKSPLVAQHVYAITNVDRARRTVTIRNPWGWEGEQTLTWEIYQSVMRETNAAPTRQPPRR